MILPFIHPARFTVTDSVAPKRYIITAITTTSTSDVTVAASAATVVLCQTRDEFHYRRARDTPATLLGTYRLYHDLLALSRALSDPASV